VYAAAGGWSSVFRASAILNFAAAIMALVVLKPLRLRMKRRVDELADVH
jgi:hypothetical protein